MGELIKNKSVEIKDNKNKFLFTNLYGLRNVPHDITGSLSQQYHT